jgi:DNA-binding transcriptional MerR regulator
MQPLSPANDGKQFWKIGELAEKTGLSVRTLHYYEELGLLRPRYRTTGSHRLYGEDDVMRLQQVLSLKQLGFPLDQIKAALENPAFSPEKILAMQAERIAAELKGHERLLARVRGMQRLMKATKRAGAEEFLELIKSMSEIDAQYTPDELDEIHERGTKLGEHGMAKAENEWSTLIAAVQKEMDAGTPPTDPKVKKLAKQWQSLIDAFTGGNPVIAEKMKVMYEKQGSQMQQTFGGPSQEMREYVVKCMHHMAKQSI